MLRKTFFRELLPTLTPGAIVFFLIIFQSCGIPIFEKKGTIIAVVVLFLARNGFQYLTAKHLLIICGILLFLIVNFSVNPAFELSNLIFQCCLVIETYIFLLSYKKAGIYRLQNDFIRCLHFIFLHSLAGYLLYLTIPVLFQEVSFNYPYRTFMFCFYVTVDNNDVARNTGILWEPGLLQLMLNIFLFYAIRTRRPDWFLLIIVITVLTTYSTSGYFCLAVNYLYFVLSNLKTRKKFVMTLVGLTVFFSSFLVFILENINDKLGGENLSGLARYRDFYIGWELIKEKPLMGHGLFNESYLFTKPYVTAIEVRLFGARTLDIIGSISGGFVNGIMDVFAWFGLPAGLLLFILFYKNKFVGVKLERIVFFIILCFTFFAEPITYTSFFLMFPFSAIIFEQKLNKITGKQSIKLT